MKSFALLVGIAFAKSLEGDGFNQPKPDIWRNDRFGSIVSHVLEKVDVGDISTAISEFDAYSESNRMGMNLGAPKGNVIEKVLNRALTARNQGSPLVTLELGAHLGDGTLRIIRPMLENPSSNAPHVVVSVDDNHEWASGCAKVVAHALGDREDVVHHYVIHSKPKTMSAAAMAALRYVDAKSFDVILLDHDHAMYLDDIKDLVKQGALTPGTLVHADNAGRDSRVLKSYLKYVNTGGAGNFVTLLEPISKPYPDKVAVSEFQGATEEL